MSSRLLRASATSSVRHCIMIMAVSVASCKSSGKVLGTIDGIIRGDWPRCNWNLENLVEAFTVFMIWNQICGKARTHPFWFLCM